GLRDHSPADPGSECVVRPAIRLGQQRAQCLVAFAAHLAGSRIRLIFSRARATRLSSVPRGISMIIAASPCERIHPSLPRLRLLLDESETKYFQRRSGEGHDLVVAVVADIGMAEKADAPALAPMA